MAGTIECMKQLFVFFTAIFFFLAPKVINAAEEPRFTITGNFIYELTENGSFKVRQEVQIKNLTTAHYAPSFLFNVSGFQPENLAVYESGIASKLTKKSEQEYEVTFKSPALGRGSTKKVAVTFEDDSLLTKKGEVTEMRIPRLQNVEMLDHYLVTVRIPKADAERLHMFPDVHGMQKGHYVEYVFDEQNLKNHPVTAFIGDTAAYSFGLTYPLVNDSHFTKTVTFAVPPDTAFQKVFLDTLDPAVESLTYDSDGNWVGTVHLKAGERRKITVSGTVLVYAEAQSSYPRPNAEALKLNTRPARYWESDSPEIQEIANSLDSVESIYNYVTSNLSYDYTKTTRPQERMGAKLALQKKSEAICMEFTDLFIALARAKGIPAREVNGFAVSLDMARPRSLGNDILHSWPEYWDEKRNLWVPVDPTWGKTTGGVDYFSHLDLNHIAFVIHGLSSTDPQTPGTYISDTEGEDLIRIEPAGKDAVLERKDPSLIITQRGFPLLTQNFVVVVDNNTGTAIYNTVANVKAGDTTLAQEIVSILPFSTVSFPVSVKAGFMGSALPSSISVTTQHVTQVSPITKEQALLMHTLAIILPIAALVAGTIFYQKAYAKH